MASVGPFIINRCRFNFSQIFNLHFIFGIYKLTHSGSELSGFTCTSSLTMNEKFQYHSRLCGVCIENFEFMVSERVQVNPDNSRPISALVMVTGLSGVQFGL